MKATKDSKVGKRKLKNKSGLKPKNEKTKSQKKGKPTIIVNTTLIESQNKKKKRLNYSTEDMAHALKAVNTGVSLRRAAAAYGVPTATLARKKNNPDVIKKKTGPETVFSISEENEIKECLIYRAQRGMPVTKTELLDTVQQYVTMMKKKTPFIDNRPSRHWYEGFRKRHPELVIRKSQHLSLNRASVHQEDLEEWFSDQEKYLKKKNLFEIPSNRVFNCEETNIVLCPDSEKVITQLGSRLVYKIVDGGKESLTVLFMYAANGIRAPPMLMYSYKGDVPKKIVTNTPKGWGIGISNNGWITAETFYEYIVNNFYPWLLEEKVEFPVIVYLDNHSSHINIPLLKFCREKKIELIELFPNSRHIMQPLDIAFFHPFKEIWKKAVPKWKKINNSMHLKKENFPAVLKFALDTMKEKETIINGFKASGLWPFNPKSVDYNVLNKRKKKESSAEEKNSNEKFLQEFENKLSPDVLLEFKNASARGSWSGESEKKALFEYWIELTGNTSKAKPTIKSVEILSNHKVRLVVKETDIENVNINQHLPTNEIAVNNSIANIDLMPINNIPSEASANFISQKGDITALDYSIHSLDKDGYIQSQEDQEFHIETPVEQESVSNINFSNNYKIENTQSDKNPVPSDLSKENDLSNENDLLKKNDLSKENEILSSQDKIKNVFSFPIEYLPKKKKDKLKLQKKRKPLAAII